MQLGKSAKTNSLMRALAAEDGLKAMAGQGAAAEGAAGDAVAAAAAAPVQSEDVVLRAEEKLTVACTRDGGVESFECRGILSLLINNPDLTRIAIQLSQGQNEGFQMQAHPNIDKRRFAAESVLALKNANKAYPTGACARCVPSPPLPTALGTTEPRGRRRRQPGERAPVAAEHQGRGRPAPHHQLLAGVHGQLHARQHRVLP